MGTRNASVVFWIVLVFSSNSSATLIDRGPSTVDTDTRLEWLDVSQTTGVSYNQILSGYGGWLSAGWRHATEDEVDGLLSTYLGLPGISTNLDRNVATQQFISLFGATAIMPTFPLSQRIYGIFDDSYSHPFEQFVGRGDIFYEESFAYSFWEISGDKEANWSSSSFVGHFLVRPASVSEPTLVYSFLSGLLLVSMIRSRSWDLIGSMGGAFCTEGKHQA